MKSVTGKSLPTPPKYSKTLQNGVTVCDPRATRSTVALMNQNAIGGGMLIGEVHLLLRKLIVHYLVFSLSLKIMTGQRL